MAETIYYGSKANTSLEKDIVVESGDLMVQRVEIEDEMIYTSATETFAVPATYTFSDDDFNSTGKNIEIYVDEDTIAQGVITDSDGTGSTVTIVEANLTNAQDGAAVSLVDGTTYSVRIFSPTEASDIYGGVHGSYLGWITAMSVNPITERASIMIDTPQAEVAEAEVMNGYEVNFSLSNVNEDTYKDVYGMEQFGEQPSGGYKVGKGKRNSKKAFLRFYIRNRKYDDTPMVRTLLRSKMWGDGSFDAISNEFKSTPIVIKGYSDGFYPDGASLYTIEENPALA